jgi:hypothetical protein
MSNEPFFIESREWQADDLLPLIADNKPLFPELEAARANLAALRASPQAQVILALTEPLMAGIAAIPQPKYTAFRRFINDGDREEFEEPYFGRRARLSALAFRAFLGVDIAHPAVPGAGLPLKTLIEDYIWAICEETTWVLPAHEWVSVDLFSAETAFLLAQTVTLLGDQIGFEVAHRVYTEVDRRVFEPYLHTHRTMNWYMGHSNWNGVCNSSVASAFLLLERDPRRVAWALSLVMRGLQAFLDTAFESDGSSNEGVGYWHYGLINLVALSEMLRARSGGALDPLASPRLRQIAAYPPAMQLSGSVFAAFSDCDETTDFNFGIIQRLAERSGVAALRNLTAKPAKPGQDWRIQMMVRNLLWWDGAQPAAPAIADAVLSAPGVARLTGRTAAGTSYVAAIKAGHNEENHNQNDIASFVLHVDGENLLTDPGRGLYSRQYFGPNRYDNIFANSYGHSVPRIGGQLQAPGRQHRGELAEVKVKVEAKDEAKAATVEFARAYPVEALVRATRTLSVGDKGVVILTDAFEFTGKGELVEEAFVTWGEVVAHGPTAAIHSGKHTLRLVIEEPTGARFAVESLAEVCRVNHREGVLKRLTFIVPAAAEATARVKMEVE